MTTANDRGTLGTTRKGSRPAADRANENHPRKWRAFIIRLTLAVLLLLLYGYFRYTAAAMAESDFPPAFAHPIQTGNHTLMTFRNGDEDGRPIIFVHGTPGKAENWDRFLGNPRPGYYGIAVDRPGFGESTPADGYRWLKDEAAALQPLLESLGGRDPILAGHSLGGPIIAQAALDYPDLVGGLVMVAASMDPGVEKIFAIQYLGDLPGLRLIVPPVLRNSNQELIPLREDLERLFPRLKDIQCPITIVHGTDDSLVPFQNVAYMQAAFTPSALRDTIILQGEDHFLPWTNPDAIWRAIETLSESQPE